MILIMGSFGCHISVLFVQNGSIPYVLDVAHPIVLSYSLCASSFCCSLFKRPHLPIASKQPGLSRQALSGLSCRSHSQISLIDSAPISLNRQFSPERSSAVGGLPSKICVVVLARSPLLDSALRSACLGATASSLSSLLSPQSVSFPNPQWIVNVVVADTIFKTLDCARCGYTQVR